MRLLLPGRMVLLLLSVATLPVAGGCAHKVLEPACRQQCEATARTFEEAEACRQQCRDVFERTEFNPDRFSSGPTLDLAPRLE